MRIPVEVREYMARMGRKGGKIGGASKSPAKVAASRRNGRLGGRRKGSKNKRRKK